MHRRRPHGRVGRDTREGGRRRPRVPAAGQRPCTAGPTSPSPVRPTPADLPVSPCPGTAGCAGATVRRAGCTAAERTSHRGSTGGVRGRPVRPCRAGMAESLRRSRGSRPLGPAPVWFWRPAAGRCDTPMVSRRGRWRDPARSPGAVRCGLRKRFPRRPLAESSPQIRGGFGHLLRAAARDRPGRALGAGGRSSGLRREVFLARSVYARGAGAHAAATIRPLPRARERTAEVAG